MNDLLLVLCGIGAFVGAFVGAMVGVWLGRK
jgi:hypothetical protein